MANQPSMSNLQVYESATCIRIGGHLPSIFCIHWLLPNFGVLFGIIAKGEITVKFSHFHQHTN
uniref:Uncharacterized protein n=1 Tax=Arundo donax TaxID=35708 RepID=A0A0A9GUC3_ARUDO